MKLFPPKAVDIVRELIELSGKDLTPEEVAEEIRSGKKPEPQGEPAEAIERAAAPLPPEVVFEIRAMQETLARQERQIARLVAELEQEREERREEAAKLQERLDAQQRSLRSWQSGWITSIAGWTRSRSRSSSGSGEPSGGVTCPVGRPAVPGDW